MVESKNRKKDRDMRELHVPRDAASFKPSLNVHRKCKRHFNTSELDRSSKHTVYIEITLSIGWVRWPTQARPLSLDSQPYCEVKRQEDHSNKKTTPRIS